jgi:ribosome-associated protein
MKIASSELQFTFSRASGAGGQNVNKVNSKADLAWDITRSTSISEEVKLRFKQKFHHFINDDGMVKISSKRYRNQPQNIQDCIKKLELMLEQVAKPPKNRKATKPTKSSNEKRIQSKKLGSLVKKNRQKVW